MLVYKVFIFSQEKFDLIKNFYNLKEINILKNQIWFSCKKHFFTFIFSFKILEGCFL